MTLTLELTPALEERLNAEAAREGLAPDQYAVQVLERNIGSEPPQTGAELLAVLEQEGVIGAWADRTDIGDSSAFARKLRKQAETRDRS